MCTVTVIATAFRAERGSSLHPIFRLSPLLLIFVMSIYGCRVSAAEKSSCINPDVTELLGRSRNAIHFDGTYFPSPEAVFLSSIYKGRKIQWIGTKWYGPIDGALFVVDCAGTQISALRLGGVIRLKQGAATPVGQAVEVIYISTTGSGIFVSNVALAVIKSTTIKILWSHTAFDREVLPSLGVDFVDRFHWSVLPNGMSIEVTGQRQFGSIEDNQHRWNAGATHALRAQKYCWIEKDEEYQLCER